MAADGDGEGVGGGVGDGEAELAELAVQLFFSFAGTEIPREVYAQTRRLFLSWLYQVLPYVNEHHCLTSFGCMIAVAVAGGERRGRLGCWRAVDAVMAARGGRGPYMTTAAASRIPFHADTILKIDTSMA